MGLSNFGGNTGTAGADTLATLVEVKRLLVMVGVEDFNLAECTVIYSWINFMFRLFSWWAALYVGGWRHRAHRFRLGIGWAAPGLPGVCWVHVGGNDCVGRAGVGHHSATIGWAALGPAGYSQYGPAGCGGRFMILAVGIMFNYLLMDFIILLVVRVLKLVVMLVFLLLKLGVGSYMD